MTGMAILILDIKKSQKCKETVRWKIFALLYLGDEGQRTLAWREPF